MRTLTFTLILSAAALAADRPVRTFEADPVGAPPPGFLFAATREATVDRWQVRRDAETRVLAHLPDRGPSKGFAIAVLEQPRLRDLEFSARLRLAGGDRSGGLVWRYQDAENCYMTRLDLQEQKIWLYRIVRGNRVRLESTDDLELDPSAWHVLEARHDQERIRVYLGGIKVFDVRDRTFADAGRAGVWASGSSQLHFDDLRLEDRADRDR
jgi:hypothetical protein